MTLHSHADSPLPLRDTRRINRRHADQAESSEVMLGYPNALRTRSAPRSSTSHDACSTTLAVRRSAPVREELEDADVHHGCAFDLGAGGGSLQRAVMRHF